MATVTISKYCPKWLELLVQANVLLYNTAEEVKESLENAPWLDVTYTHKDEPVKLLAKQNMFVTMTECTVDKVIEVIQGEEEVLVTLVYP